MWNQYQHSSLHDPCTQHHTCSWQECPSTLIHHHSMLCSRQQNMSQPQYQHQWDRGLQSHSSSHQRKCKHSHKSTLRSLGKYHRLYNMPCNQQQHKIHEGTSYLHRGSSLLADSRLGHNYKLEDFQHSSQQYSNSDIQHQHMNQQQ